MHEQTDLHDVNYYFHERQMDRQAHKIVPLRTTTVDRYWNFFQGKCEKEDYPALMPVSLEKED